MWTTKLNTRLITTVFALGMCSSVFAGRIIYVEPDVTGNRNGSGADLQFDIQYPSIQAAIDAAVDGDTVILAPGTFRGDGNRDIDFKGKAITLGSTNPNDPDIVAATIIDCNGTESEPHRGFYFHSEEDANSIIAGLTVINGVAWKGGAVLCSHSSPKFTDCVFRGNEAYDDDTGGGAMYNEDCSPTLIDCLFTDNEAMPSASYGGGITNHRSSPTLTNCTFINNRAWSGGGIYNTENSSPKVTECVFTNNAAARGGGMTCEGGNAILSHCSFIENSASYYGGGLNNIIASNTTLLNCTFSDNSATNNGGGMFNEDSNPTLLNCTFNGNSAGSDGGGMFNGYSDSAPTLLNCTFSGNDAGGDGGAMYYMYSRPILTNCIFSRNSASYGGGISIDWCSYSIITNCIFISNSADMNGGGMNNYDCCFGDSILTNCIFWNNSDSGGMGESAQIYNHEGYGSCNPVINYSCVQEGYPGVGNIDVDPLFVDPSNGDYHLKSQAGRWDMNSSSWVQDDVTSLCIDAGDPMAPIMNEPFPNGGIINMGAYGGTAEASKSYFGKPICETIVAGDINGDCIVNLLDLSFMARNWLQGLH